MPAPDATRIPKEVQLECSRCGSRMFVNTVGLFRTIRSDGSEAKLMTGLCKGSSDLIGWTPVTITPEDVGKQIAVFTAIEVKTGKATTTKEQKAFIKAVSEAGGIAAVARRAGDVEGILKGNKDGD